MKPRRRMLHWLLAATAAAPLFNIVVCRGDPGGFVFRGDFDDDRNTFDDILDDIEDFFDDVFD